MSIIKPNTAFPTGADWPSATARGYITEQLALHVDTVADVNSGDLEFAWWVFVKATGRLYRLDMASGAPDNGDTVLLDNQARRYVAVSSGASGYYLETDALVGALPSTAEVPVKTTAGARRATVAQLRPVSGFYPRAGTMSDKTGDGLLFMSTATPAFVDPSAGAAATKYNGAAIAGVAAFTFNNTTYGGTDAALHASVQALIDAAKAVDDLANPAYAYGQPFWIAKLTAGTGTTSPGSDAAAGTYLAAYPFVNLLVNTPMTARIMARVVSGSAFILKNNDSILFRNGTIDTSTFVALDGSYRHFVEHIAVGGLSGRGYAFPLRLYCSPNAEVEFALPDFCPGHVNLPFHARPLLAGNRT